MVSTGGVLGWAAAVRRGLRGLCAGLLLAGLCMPALAEQTLVIPGTGDAIAVLRALAVAFNRQHAGELRVEVPDSVGSSGGIRAVMRDQAPLARTARPLKPREQAAGLAAVPWASYPVVFYAHPGISVRNVDGQALEAVYRGRIRNWQALGGANGRIRLIHREKGDSCRRRIEAELPRLFPDHDGPRAMTTVTTQATLRAVREYAGALAYGPYPELVGRDYRVLSLDGLAPTAADYPLRNTLYFVYHKDVPLPPAARAFLEFVDSEAGHALIRRLGARPVEPDATRP